MYGCLAALNGALNQLYLFCSVCYPCMSCVLFCKHSGRVAHLVTLAFIQGPVWFPVCRVQADCPRFYSDSWLSFAQSNTNFISLSYILWWKHPRIKGCELFGPPTASTGTEGSTATLADPVYPIFILPSRQQQSQKRGSSRNAVSKWPKKQDVCCRC